MVAKLYARGQDPDDKSVDSSFPWRTAADISPGNMANMDEMGADTNKGRKKKVCSKDALSDGLQHNFDITDGDNNPFHTTICLTTWACGSLHTPPLLGHSNPKSNSKTLPKLTATYVEGLLEKVCTHPHAHTHESTNKNVYMRFAPAYGEEAAAVVPEAVG